MLTDTLFHNKKPEERRLLDYGFVAEAGCYRYSVGLADGQLMMTVTVSAEGGVTAAVTDAASGDEYVLHRVARSAGAFVGRVKEEYGAVLRAIAENCFARDVFKSEYAKMVIAYVRERYGGELEYLWERFPNNAVWRRADNAKWYGALLTVEKNRLGIGGAETVEIIDLRIQPEKLADVVDGARYFPGYHMNKKHWFTICLDGSVPVEEICPWIDASYALAAKK